LAQDEGGWPTPALASLHPGMRVGFYSTVGKVVPGSVQTGAENLSFAQTGPPDRPARQTSRT